MKEEFEKVRMMRNRKRLYREKEVIHSGGGYIHERVVKREQKKNQKRKVR